MPVNAKYNPEDVQIAEFKVNVCHYEGQYYWRSMDLANAIDRRGFRSVIQKYREDEHRKTFPGSKAIYLSEEGTRKFLQSSRKYEIVEPFRKAWESWLENRRKEDKNKRRGSHKKRKLTNTKNWWEEINQHKWTKEEAQSPPLPLEGWEDGEFVPQRTSERLLLEACVITEKTKNRPHFFFSLLTNPNRPKIPMEDHCIELRSGSVKQTILVPPFIITSSSKVVLLPRTGSEELILLKDHCPFPWSIFHLQNAVAVQSCAFQLLQVENRDLPKERQKPIPKRNLMAEKFLSETHADCCPGYIETRGPLYVLPENCIERLEEIFLNPSWENVAEFYSCINNNNKRYKRQ